MSEIKIKIENLYKIFGSRPREYTDIVRDGVDTVSYTHLTLPTKA